MRTQTLSLPWLLFALTFSAVVGVLAPACGGDAACSAKTCPDGCCGADGMCRASSPQSCGLAGARCDDCTSRRQGCFDGTCQAYQQQCLPLERNCSVDAVCCSQICSGGLCSNARCRGGNQLCDKGTDCCSGVCNASQRCAATTCGGAGNPCSPDETCCAPLLCGAEGFCVPPCKGAGAACAQGTECCTGVCQGGVCTGGQSTCQAFGDDCAVDGDCCSGLFCNNARCGN